MRSSSPKSQRSKGKRQVLNKSNIDGQASKKSSKAQVNKDMGASSDDLMPSDEEEKMKLEPPVDLSTLTKKETRKLQEHPIYKGITAKHDVEKNFYNYMDEFDNLEKEDIYDKLNPAERDWAEQVERDRVMGITRPQDYSEKKRAFDDPTEPDNQGFIQDQLKNLSQNKYPDSDFSMESGDGNYSDDANNDNMSEDSDLQRLKVLTKERFVKQQQQLDLERIERHRAGGKSKDGHTSQTNIGGVLKEEHEDDLSPEKLALHAAIQTGDLDLFKRAQQLNKKTANQVIAINQGEDTDRDPEEDILAGITDDEEFNQEVKDLALGKGLGVGELKMKDFDAENSYFSEDDEDVAKDEIMTWQRETHGMKFNKGSLLDPVEDRLMNSGYEQRETKKADRLQLDSIGTNIHSKTYTAKDILKRMKKAGVQGKTKEVEAAEEELKMIQQEEKKQNKLKSKLKNEDKNGNNKFTEKNRLFRRNLNEGKMYTDRYVRRMKAAQNKLMDKFTMGAKYALTAQKKIIMSRARRLVTDSNKKLLDSFQNEALSLIYQVTTLAKQLKTTEKQRDHLLEANKALEIDLSLVLRQQDYIEERIPEKMKNVTAIKEQKIRWDDKEKAEFNQANEEYAKCVPPEQKGTLLKKKFNYDDVPIDARVARASMRSQVMAKYEDMEPLMSDQVFDFYNLYTRISEHQKFKYAESRLILYYKDIIEEVLGENENLQGQIETLLIVNMRAESNQQEVKQKMKMEKEKREQLIKQMEIQKEEFKSKIQEIIGNRHEEKMDLTKYYNDQIRLLESEIKTSHSIRDILTNNNKMLKTEIETLAKVIKTSRNHFKNLEQCNLESLNQQIQKYEGQIAKLMVSESEVESLRAKKAKKLQNEKQQRADRKGYNKRAEKLKFDKQKKPIDEMTPIQQLKELKRIKGPKKVHEKMTRVNLETQASSIEAVVAANRNVSLQTVLNQQRDKAMQFIDTPGATPDLTVTTIDRGANLNDESLTEGSIETVLPEEVFQTKMKSARNSQKDDILQEQRRPIQIRKQGGSDHFDSFTPFQASQKDVESDHQMLLENQTEDINKYLAEQLSNKNQDLVEHDQILISEHGADTSRDIQLFRLASFSSSSDSKGRKKEKFTNNQRSRSHLKPRKKGTDLAIKQQDQTKRPPFKLLGSESKEHTPKIKVQVSTKSRQNIGGVTITADSSKFTGEEEFQAETKQTRNSGRMKNFSVDNDSFGQDSFTRLKTANQLVGLPRRDPLKQKIIPKLQGVMGGETAKDTLRTLDHTINQMGMTNKLPKIKDVRFSQHGRRHQSIPPKTAAANMGGTMTTPNNARLQSLVNNNAFLGRGTFTSRVNSTQASPRQNNTNAQQPVSPPSFQVHGTSNIISPHPIASRGNKVRVKVPDTAKYGHQQTPPKHQPFKTMNIQQARDHLRVKTNPFSDSFNKIPNSDMAGIDDDTFTVSKLNLPSTKGKQSTKKEESPDPSPRQMRLSKNPTQDLMLPSQDDKSPMNVSQRPRGLVNNSEVRHVARRESSKSRKDFHSVKTLTNKHSSKLTYDVLAPKDLSRDASEIQVDDEEEAPEKEYNIMKTTLNTIELRSDHLDEMPALQKSPQGKSPRKAHGGKRPAPQSKGLAPSQPIKKKNKMVSPEKKKEKALKEQKQQKLKMQLENVVKIEATVPQEVDEDEKKRLAKTESI